MGLTHTLSITSKPKKTCFMNTKSKKLTQFKELGQNCTTKHPDAPTLRHHKKDGWPMPGWLSVRLHLKTTECAEDKIIFTGK